MDNVVPVNTDAEPWYIKLGAFTISLWISCLFGSYAFNYFGLARLEYGTATADDVFGVFGWVTIAQYLWYISIISGAATIIILAYMLARINHDTNRK